jgi:hypothetical protein
MDIEVELIETMESLRVEGRSYKVDNETIIRA